MFLNGKVTTYKLIVQYSKKLNICQIVRALHFAFHQDKNDKLRFVVFLFLLFKGDIALSLHGRIVEILAEHSSASISPCFAGYRFVKISTMIFSLAYSGDTVLKNRVGSE